MNSRPKQQSDAGVEGSIEQSSDFDILNSWWRKLEVERVQTPTKKARTVRTRVP